MKHVGIFEIVFRVKRAFRSLISTESYAIHWALYMLIFNCILVARPNTPSALSRRFWGSRPHCPPSPETGFGRLILKEVDFNAELFVKATCQNKSLTQPLKSPLIHLPLPLPLKVLFPLSRSSPLNLTSGFVNNQLRDYLNEVINYWPSLPLFVPQVSVPIITQRQPSWVILSCDLAGLCVTWLSLPVGSSWLMRL